MAMDITQLLAFSVKNKASDLHLSAGLPPMIRVHGDVRRINLPPLEHKDVHAMIYDIMNDQQRKHYDETYDVDFSFALPGLARFRVNAFMQDRGSSAVMRTIPSRVLSLEELDRVLGLSIGADDYITKPFSMEELLYRMQAVLRRTKGDINKKRDIYQIGRYKFDTHKQLLIFGDREQKLTTKESELLRLLCNNANQVLERNFALRTIWIDDNYFNARSMDVYITKLRKYLKEDPSIEIMNIHGTGYKLIM